MLKRCVACTIILAVIIGVIGYIPVYKASKEATSSWKHLVYQQFSFIEDMYPEANSQKNIEFLSTPVAVVLDPIRDVFDSKRTLSMRYTNREAALQAYKLHYRASSLYGILRDKVIPWFIDNPYTIISNAADSFDVRNDYSMDLVAYWVYESGETLLGTKLKKEE